ncbi:MAG: cytochrome C [Proteobacteria bacterium]|nr:cytochrome C [Pseudomonadota bacterium]
MRLLLKIIGGLLLLAALGAGVAWFVLSSTYPKVGPAPVIDFSKGGKDRVAHGRYLAENVAFCITCHSTRDWTRQSGPVTPGTEGKGGDAFDRTYGVPGTVHASNITPAHLGSWSDSDVARAITCGVTADGKALFPIMPYLIYRHLAKSDVADIVMYLRTLKPLQNEIPARKLTFPMNLVVRMLPQPAELLDAPPTAKDGTAYGEYLTAMASCMPCHSQRVHGTFKAGLEYAGGVEFRVPGMSGVERSANITPDAETGIGKWTRAQFIARFKSMDPARHPPASVKPGEMSSVMPWTAYGGMTEDDLGAIYDYLQTLGPVKNAVQAYSPQ